MCIWPCDEDIYIRRVPPRGAHPPVRREISDVPSRVIRAEVRERPTRAALPAITSSKAPKTLPSKPTNGSLPDKGPRSTIQQAEKPEKRDSKFHPKKRKDGNPDRENDPKDCRCCQGTCGKRHVNKDSRSRSDRTRDGTTNGGQISRSNTKTRPGPRQKLSKAKTEANPEDNKETKTEAKAEENSKEKIRDGAKVSRSSLMEETQDEREVKQEAKPDPKPKEKQEPETELKPNTTAEPKTTSRAGTSSRPSSRPTSPPQSPPHQPLPPRASPAPSTTTTSKGAKTPSLFSSSGPSSLSSSKAKTTPTSSRPLTPTPIPLLTQLQITEHISDLRKREQEDRDRESEIRFLEREERDERNLVDTRREAVRAKEMLERELRRRRRVGR